MIIGVVAHNERRIQAKELFDTVNADVGNVDDGTLRCEGNHLVVLNQLLNYPAPAQWAAVLEDDAVPVPDFRQHLTRALQYAPAPFVGLYLGTGNPVGETQRQIRLAVAGADTHKAWITADCLIGSVGYAVKTELLADMIGFITDRDEELPLRISRWAQARTIDIAYTQPSLVNHNDGESVGQLWRGPYYSGRRAHNYGTRRCWCTAAVRLGFCPVWSAPKEVP